MIANEILAGTDRFRAFCATPLPATREGEWTGADFYVGLAHTPRQVHSTRVCVIDSDSRNDHPEGDALVTFRRHTPIGVVTADCVPILIYAPDVEAVAAIHAGWRGTIGRIVDTTVEVLKAHGASPSEMSVIFGPSILAPHYEVSPELADDFTAAGFGDFVCRPGPAGSRPHLDLQGVNARLLLDRGVRPENIRLSDRSTFDFRDTDGRFRYPSYRRDRGTSLRLLTAIELL